MPNHCYNRVIVPLTDTVTAADVLAAACDENQMVDFEKLLPMPLNIWRGNIGDTHVKAFGEAHTWRHWAEREWGTKWNAYDGKPAVVTDTHVELWFVTAWNCPHPWLIALFNALRTPFTYDALNEYNIDYIHHGEFTIKADRTDPSGYECWSETKQTGDAHVEMMRRAGYDEDDDTDK